jgi:hypothetical protein
VGGTLRDDYFVPKQLGVPDVLGLLRLSPALMVRWRPQLFAAVRRGCHAVRHSVPTSRPTSLCDVEGINCPC